MPRGFLSARLGPIIILVYRKDWKADQVVCQERFGFLQYRIFRKRVICNVARGVAGYSFLRLAITDTMRKRGLFWKCLKKQNMFLMSAMIKLNIPHLNGNKLNLYREVTLERILTYICFIFDYNVLQYIISNCWLLIISNKWNINQWCGREKKISETTRKHLRWFLVFNQFDPTPC